jgi:FAD-dependent oxidoreductase domain-containing protein 1
VNRTVVIVGGAAIGAASAYFLKVLEPGLAVTVIERDPTYKHSSTVLSDGNVRVQFNLEENILMSSFALEVLATFSDTMSVGDWRPDVAARHQGNLFLTDSSQRIEAEAGLAKQKALGCEVEWLDPSEIARRFPPYAGDGYVGGTFGTHDGSMDPSAVLSGYVRKSAALGVDYLSAEASALLVDGDHISGVVLSDGRRLDAPVVVNATGAWCAQLAATVGVDLPVNPVMRSVYIIETAIDNRNLPSVFLPKGLYVLPESPGRFLVGWSQPDDPVGFDFTISRERFNERVWPELGGQLPAFEALHLAGGWAGLYEVNTLDGNAILGEWPTIRGLYLANGFSGHGFQQCHAVGRYVAELIVGATPTLDLARFGPQRILDRDPIYEHAGRII